MSKAKNNKSLKDTTWKKNYKLAWAIIFSLCTIVYFVGSLTNVLSLEGLIGEAPPGSVNANYFGYDEYHLWLNTVSQSYDTHSQEAAISYYQYLADFYAIPENIEVSDELHSWQYYDIITTFDGKWGITKTIEYTVHFFSYFTIQSTIFVLVWLFIAWKKHETEGKSGVLTNEWALAVTIYILITGIIYCTMILPSNLPESFGEWTVKLTLHVVSPIIFTTYYLFIMNRETSDLVSVKETFKKSTLKMFIYPIAFGMISIAYGTARYYENHLFAFQYEFLMVVEDCPYILGGISGWWLLLIAFLFSSSIILVGVPALYGITRSYNLSKNK